jgi:hypothetical protein
MASPIRGRLISSSFAADALPSLPLFVAPQPAVRRRMERCAEQLGERLGPASGARAVADIAVMPLLGLLDLVPAARDDAPAACRIHTTAGADVGPLVVVTPYGESLDCAWRAAVRTAIAHDARWCLCCNGQHLRVVDARRTWSRAYLEFDLAAALDDEDGQAVIWSLLRAEAMAPPVTVLDQAVQASARHGADVCRSLGRGVLDALTLLLGALHRLRRPDAADVFEHSLTVLYRVLFLLFAEARGLVPLWHPVYRDRYSVNTIVSTLLAGRSYRGLWQALQAITRLAHAGCAAGELKVNAFNGRLFSPTQAASFAKQPIGEDVMKGAIVAVSSTPGTASRPRTRISYRDLDVEQLGAVYEQVLDYEPDPRGPATLVRTRDARKSSGAFYTPRALTASLVRQTLAPLVHSRSSDEIFALRIVDPAMGSGAFLVAACRFLAAAAEDALIEEGRWHAGDVTDSDRALLRRDIATRCLYGVDLNPMAVQLARLSLWLATLASDKPLSFLDHHLVAGDSLIGASPADVQRQPGRDRKTTRRARDLPLFDTPGLDESLVAAASIRTRLATEPDDTAAIVRQKERALAALAEASTPANRWQRVLDLWCAGWFWRDGPPPDRQAFGELVHALLHDHCSLPRRIVEPLLAEAAAIAAQHRFVHWPIAYPEVFAAGGFDAVIGNPPWDMMRGDTGAGGTRDDRRRLARQATDFARSSGVYLVESGAHTNRYQLFVERSVQLLRPGGRLGLVLPCGVFSDSSSAALRRHLFERARVETVTGLDNRRGIFPIHRSVRFALVTASAGLPTGRIACRFGLTSLDEIDAPVRRHLDLSRDLLHRLSGRDDLGLPELTCERDLDIVERISARVPWLGSGAGWGVQFGRELNATDDRHAFRPRTGTGDARPVVEGKQLGPFLVDLAASALELPLDAPAGRRVPHRTRLAYRDVASATNRLTLIAALLPPIAVTTHTVFCLKTLLPLSHQRVLCALLNSFVANYLIRLRVNTHVTASLLSRLPVPAIASGGAVFERLDALVHSLTNLRNVEASSEYAELQALVAHAYGLNDEQFAHVLSTFPLIADSTRRACFERFTRGRYHVAGN